jgi:pSer/pThr/pTyr-binding forkhead associated (FHA) protein
VELLFAVHSKADQADHETRSEVKDRVVFGRTPDSPIPIDGPGVSREHFAVQVDTSQVFVVDLSANGTWLNGDRLTKGKQYPVASTDLVEIPGHEIRIRLPEAPVVKGTGGEQHPVEVAPVEEQAEVPAVSTQPVAVAEPKKSPLDLVRNIIGSFTGLEKFIIMVDLAGIVLLAWYFGS